MATYKYSGVVISNGTGDPIPGAEVLFDNGGTVTTDAQGRFSFTSPLDQPGWWQATAECYDYQFIEWDGRDGTAKLNYVGTTLGGHISLKEYGLNSLVRDGNISFRNKSTGTVYSDESPHAASDGSGISVDMEVVPGEYVVESAWVEQAYTHLVYTATFPDWSISVGKCDTPTESFSITITP